MTTIGLIALFATSAMVSPAIGEGLSAPDDALQAYVSRLVGTYSDGVVTLRAAQAPCDDFQACLYIEVVKKGNELVPMRQQVWGLRQPNPATIEASVFGFPTRIFEPFMPSLADAMVALWAAPEKFPRLDFDRLDLLGEAPIISSQGAVSLVSDEPFLLHRDGADSMTMNVSFDSSAVHWRDELCSEKDVVLPSLQATLQRIDEPTRVTMTEEGMIVIDLRVGEGVELEAGDSALAQFKIFRMNGQLVESSLLPGRRPLLLQPAPGKMFDGFRKGILGMVAPPRAAPRDKTHLRRLLVPPKLAFGSRGRKPIINADEPLIVDIELLTLKDNTKKKK